MLKELFISEGNPRKLGRLWNFSLMPLETCPGRSEWCSKYCYANQNGLPFYRWERNTLATRTPVFADLMIRILQAIDGREIDEEGKRPPKLAKTLRLHTSGDFFSREYVQAWQTVVEAMSDWKFYGYTRSWRTELLPALENLKACSNVVLWASTDETTGPPPLGWREAGVEKCHNGNAVLCSNMINPSVKCSNCTPFGPWCSSEQTNNIYFHKHGKVK